MVRDCCSVLREGGGGESWQGQLFEFFPPGGSHWGRQGLLGGSFAAADMMDLGCCEVWRAGGAHSSSRLGMR